MLEVERAGQVFMASSADNFFDAARRVDIAVPKSLANVIVTQQKRAPLVATVRRGLWLDVRVGTDPIADQFIHYDQLLDAFAAGLHPCNIAVTLKLVALAITATGLDKVAQHRPDAMLLLPAYLIREKTPLEWYVLRCTGASIATDVYRCNTR